MDNDCAVTLSIEVRGKGHSDLRVLVKLHVAV